MMKKGAFLFVWEDNRSVVANVCQITSDGKTNAYIQVFRILLGLRYRQKHLQICFQDNSVASALVREEHTGLNISSSFKNNIIALWQHCLFCCS